MYKILNYFNLMDFINPKKSTFWKKQGKLQIFYVSKESWPGSDAFKHNEMYIKNLCEGY